MLLTARLTAQELAPPVSITAAEYFFDTDPGSGNGISVVVNTSIEKAFIDNVEIDVDQLSVGFHALYIRFKDADGLWGIPLRRVFYKPAEIPEKTVSNAEIFFNGNVEFGAGISASVNPGEVVSIEKEIDLESTNLTPGFHKAYVRVQDNFGTWGNYASRLFYVPDTKTISPISGAEYFYDDLGQPGTGIAVEAAGSMETGLATITDTQVDAPSEAGFHRLFFRFKDSDNTWGIPRGFSVYQPEERVLSKINQLEYFSGNRPAFGAGNVIDVEPSATLTEQLDISLDGFQTGFNRFYFRLKDESGTWGNYTSRLVFIPKALTESQNITDVEYFFSGAKHPSDGQGMDLQPVTLTGFYDSTTVDARALVTLTQSIGSHAIYVRTKDATEQWGVPTPAPITIANQRDFQGQVWKDGNFEPNRIISLYKDDVWVKNDTTEDYGLFTFQALEAGNYEAKLIPSSTTKLGAAITPYGSTGLQSISANLPQLNLTDIDVVTPLHVIGTSPSPYENKMRATDQITVSFSGKFVNNSFNSTNVSLVSNLRGNLSLQITAQSNDSVLVIKPIKSLLANEKVTLSINSTYISQEGVTVLPYSTHYRVQVSNGGTTFETAAELTLNTANTTYYGKSFQAGDLDGDNDIDLVALMNYGNTVDSVFVYFNDGNGNYPDMVRFRGITNSSSGAFHRISLFLGDYNKDGSTDIGIFHVYATNIYDTSPNKTAQIYLYKNNGAGTFSLEDVLETTVYAFVDNVKFADFDYDGYPEIVVPSYTTTSTIMIIKNNAGTFNISNAVTSTQQAYDVTPVDVTGDGLLDMVVASSTNNNGKLYVGTNNSISDFFQHENTFYRPGYYHTFIFDDFTRNNKIDVIGYSFNTVGYFFNDITADPGYLSNGITFSVPSGSEVGGLDVGDLDNNGRLDVVSSTSTYLNYYTYTDNLFSKKSDLSNNSTTKSFPKLIDVDKDGDLDVVYMIYPSSQPKIQILKNISVSTNSAPVVANVLDDLDLRLTDSPQNIDLTSTFSDADGNDLSYTVLSSKPSVASVSDAVNKLFSITPNAIGNTTITVTADDDRGGVVSTNFIVYVNAPDNYTPRVASPIATVETRVADDSTTINLTTVFDDPDAGDVLSYSTNNPNPSVAEISIANGSTLIIKPIALGSITVKVTASDGKAEAENEFVVTVGPRENRAPSVLSVIPNQSINLGDAAIQLDPSVYFSDPDGDVLTYSITADNPSIAGGSYNSGNNKILITGTAAGSTTLTVTAQDPGGKTNSSAFNIYVNARPRITGNIADVVLVLGGNSAIYTLNSLFTDDNGESMTYQTSSNNPSVANIAANSVNNSLTITAFSEGETSVTVKAQDATTESSVLTINVTVKTQAFSTQSSNSAVSAYSDGIIVKNWTLLSIPGTGINTAPADLFADIIPGKDYRLFDMNTSGEYYDVSEEAGPVFGTGKSLWFKTLGLDQKFELQTGAGSRMTNRTFSINFNNYRFIANPYETEVSWSANLSTVKMWKFSAVSQNWTTVQTTEKLKPWGGYLVYSSSNATVTLSLDTVTPTSMNSDVPLKQALPDEFQLLSDIIIDNEWLRLVNRSSAISEFDEFDEPLLPSAPDIKTLPAYIKGDGVALTTDAQPLAFTDEDFVNSYREIVIPKGHRKISWSGNMFNDTHVLALVSNDMYKVLEPGDSLKWLDASKERVFKAYIGTRELVEKHVLPEQPFLFDNFPNPFNPTTVLRFAVTKPAHVRLEVFDILGRKISTLVNSAFDAGYHTTNFNGMQLASGVYLYRLTIDNQVVDVKKMTLLK